MECSPRADRLVRKYTVCENAKERCSILLRRAFPDDSPLTSVMPRVPSLL